MNVAKAVDTLTVTRDLEAAGVGRRQAEAIAGATDDTLATKADLAALEARLMRLYFGASIAQVAAIVGLLKLL